MVNTRECGSVNRPPGLDETDYAYWKAPICVFLKSVDNKTWKAIINGWTPPTFEDTVGLVVSFKDEKD